MIDCKQSPMATGTRHLLKFSAVAVEVPPLEESPAGTRPKRINDYDRTQRCGAIIVITE
jgi:hypothetical protein